MSTPNDETTEYLIEEYALNRLEGEGLVRVEALLRDHPELRARVDDLRHEADLLARSLSQSARDDAEPIEDATLALLLDGALDDIRRATLQSSLAGDLASQARLRELYREVHAVLNDEPLPGNEVQGEVTSTVIPLEPTVSTVATALELNGLLASIGLFAVSVVSPGRIGIPVLFLALAAFGWWVARSVAAGALKPSQRQQSFWGLAPAGILFATAIFAGPAALWCYVLSAAWYWYWLVQRWGMKTAALRRLPREHDDTQSDRASAGRG